MKIKSITPYQIVFDNGNYINYDHEHWCCENNYADFEQLDDLALGYEFPTELKFETIDGSGFRFGDDKMMFFVPCYSEQNGWYTTEIVIFYHKGNKDVEEYPMEAQLSDEYC